MSSIIAAWGAVSKFLDMRSKTDAYSVLMRKNHLIEEDNYLIQEISRKLPTGAGVVANFWQGWHV